MAKVKEEKEEITPIRCICGAYPALVIYRGKKMLSCPNTIVCAMRSRFLRRTEDAIKEWNVEVEEEKHRRRADNG